MIKFQLNKKTTAFLSTYNLFEDDKIQQIQLQHRLNLVEAFGIKEGMRVLEIGCGQGDTTVAIAESVGEHGHVVAIDIASPNYGAPLTLGQATERIKKSILGKRIEFHFEMDFNKFKSDEPFDMVVLSHCSWYFKNHEDLLFYFKKMRTMTKGICIAEWDLDFNCIKQRAHFCAASILALYSNYVNNDGNIQNLFHKSHIQQLLQDAGFKVERETSIDAHYLQDGHWEKSYANTLRSKFVSSPAMIQTLIRSYYELMNASDGEVNSLNSFILLAK
jgi:cyclopropane fatty-acyl-phospholipid synthase-like methyltransferase